MWSPSPCSFFFSFLLTCVGGSQVSSNILPSSADVKEGASSSVQGVKSHGNVTGNINLFVNVTRNTTDTMAASEHGLNNVLTGNMTASEHGLRNFSKSADVSEGGSVESFNAQGAAVLDHLYRAQWFQEQQRLRQGMEEVGDQVHALADAFNSGLSHHHRTVQDDLEKTNNFTSQIFAKLSQMSSATQKAATQEMARLRQENQDLLEARLRDAQSVVEAMRDKVEAEEMMSQAVEERQLAEEAKRQLEEEKEAVIRERDDIEEMKRRAEDESKVLGRKIDEALADVAALRANHSLSRVEATDLGQKLEETKEEIRNIEQEKGNLEEKVKELEMSKNTIMAEKRQVMEDYTQVLQEAGRCTANLTRLSSRLLVARDCAELYCGGVHSDGVYTIAPASTGGLVSVYCDMTTDGGGWTIFLARYQGQTPNENFDRDWSDYKQGFGRPWAEHWMGLEHLYHVTARATGSHLRLDATSLNGETSRWGLWTGFVVHSEATNYRLGVGDWQAESTMGDVFVAHHTLNDRPFSTRDRDNDNSADRDCVKEFSVGGGWWYNNCAYIVPTGPHAGSGRHMMTLWTHGNRNWVSVSSLRLMTRPAAFPACPDH